VLNSSLFIRYFILSSALIGLFFFLSSFSGRTAGMEEDILAYTNQFRKSKGLSALMMRKDLNVIARKHSEDMARGRRTFGHGGFDQRTREVRKIFKSCTLAENVAYGSVSGKDVVAMWKQSSGHRGNMLGQYDYVGIGIAKDRKGIYYFTQIFVR
jgi:uncharacterized protein YkwD